MDDEENMCGTLWSTVKESLGSHVVDAIACTCNEVVVCVIKVTLDYEEERLITFLCKVWAAKKEKRKQIHLQVKYCLIILT